VFRPLVRIALLAALSSCATNGAPEPPRSTSRVLTREEIGEAPVANVYEAVSRFRPRFLQAHATGSAHQAYPIVFVDGIRRGTFDVLRSIPVASLEEVRYLTPADATTRYGLDIEGGVLDVKLVHR
jgi:hypothetical protein